jgi:L-threonylcarbamoyladenylate synthase
MKVSSRVVRLKSRRLPKSVAMEVAAVLRAGGVVALPTDTVYGLAASVFRPEAIRRIYRLKGRSYKKPFPFLVSGLDRALALVEPPSARLHKLLDRYWPGPLTVVFNTSDLGRWTARGKDTLAVRVPKHATTLAVLRAFDGPLAVTSANHSGQPPAVTGEEVVALFGGRVELILDAGPCPVGEASTVLDASSSAWTLVREGAVKKKELLKFL